ncbi:MAG TPA: discoidin domain-containing protein [Rariglobus sp.]
MFTLILLAGAGFGYAMMRFNESPQQVWKRLVDVAERLTQPDPPPVPPPAPAPAPSGTNEIANLPAEAEVQAEAPPEDVVTEDPASQVPGGETTTAEPAQAEQETPAPATDAISPTPQPGPSIKGVAFPTPRYASPGVILNRQDLETLKANLKREPWKSGFEMLSNEGRSKLDYKMAGPFAEIKRAPNENLWPWRGDMIAIWNLSRMWYFTGNPAYAQKAHDILLAWATTHTKFGGRESMLDLGDYAICFVGGADILRGTWPGWTRADTAAVKKYFNDVLIPASNPYGESQFGAANKGALALCAKGLMAIFNEDTPMLKTVVAQIRSLAHIGLRSSNDLGMIGDSLRDQGHAHGQLVSLATLAEALWKQGIDIYSDYDNRLLAAGEYFARVNERVPTPFLPFGTTDAYYTADNTGHGWGGGNVALNLIHGAYVVRKGLPAPYIVQRRPGLPVDGGSFMFIKQVDRSVATPLLPPPIPATTSITSGFNNVEIGDAAPTGRASYSNGTWTVQGGGSEIWKASDSCHFTYKAITGNCAIIAKVEAVQNTSPSAKAGVMMRTSLSENSPRAWMAISGEGHLQQNMPNLAVYGGANYGNKILARSVAPYWVKLERMGNIISGYVSPDGTNWAATDVGRIDAPVPNTIYVGLLVCSTSNGTLNSSTFSNVQITGGDGRAPVATPAAPAALLASPGDGAVPLRWQSSFGAASYTVKRATSSGGPYSAVASGITTASYTDKTVTNGTTYYYVVSATNSAGTSGDSPEDGTTPGRPPVNIAFGGTATASDEGTGPQTAFDTNVRTRWFNNDKGATGWLQYDFGSGVTRTITCYSVASAVDVPGRDPKDWEFQGSKDGASWTTLDTQSNQTFVNRFEMKRFPILKPAAYRYYRLNITANNGAKGTHVAELGLYADPIRKTAAGTATSSDAGR